MRNAKLRRLIWTAVFLALGFVLPLLFGQMPEVGTVLLPMHIPVFLCAFLCGARYAAPMAALLPLLRAVLFGRPALYPDAAAIALELLTYALAAGLLYAVFPKGRLSSLYLSLLSAMLCGRVVRGLAQASFLGLVGEPFAFGAFFGGVILVSLPGILLQLVLIPPVFRILYRIFDPERRAL